MWQISYPSGNGASQGNFFLPVFVLKVLMNKLLTYLLTMMVFKFELLDFFFSQKLINSHPCWDLNRGPSRQQATMIYHFFNLI